MRLTDLLANAGGVAPSGADMVLILSGTRNGQPYRARESTCRPSSRPAAANKDVRRSRTATSSGSSAQPMVYIYGEVQRPGPMRLERGMTLMQSLATGGGITQRGTEKGHSRSTAKAAGRQDRSCHQLPKMDEGLKRWRCRVCAKKVLF